jgi:hypothetical protein
MLVLENKRLKQARPSLFKVAPLVYCICWGFAIVNLLIALGMATFVATKPIAIAQLLTYRQWGAVFGLLAIVGAYSLSSNNWKLARNVMLAGLAVKAVWLVALIARAFIVPSTLLITAVWLFIAYVQALTYVYFLPKIGGPDG